MGVPPRHGAPSFRRSTPRHHDQAPDDARGFRHGDFALTTSSYDGIYAFEPCAAGSRQELLWRMLIRQTFMEGLAIDNLGYEIEHRRSVNQPDIATVFEYILRDEVFHAQSGLRWSRELLGLDPQAVLKEREEAIRYFTARAEAARESFVMGNLDQAMGELAAIEAGKEQTRVENSRNVRSTGPDACRRAILTTIFARLCPGVTPSTMRAAHKSANDAFDDPRSHH